ncbi:MAG: hypothetical protein NTV51_05410 [Verrucomicrobia bacterium]|nr:hypothetical protein [Verrucomicrobiota bacterium]
MPDPRASFRPTARLRLLVGAVGALLAASQGAAQFDPSASPSSQNERPLPPANPLPIFFPPDPPPLGRLVPRLASIGTGETIAAPQELAAFVTEPFYAPLSTELARKSLDPRKREKLEAYRTARAGLLEELQTTLTQVREATPATRRSTLVDLAQRQSARLAALEADAEQLRTELATSDNDWSALRDWRLGERNVRGDSPAELGAVMRASAFYQAGLLPAQRSLVRETVIELTSGAEDATAAVAQQPYLFFSPSLTRVRLPDDLPGDLAAKVASFETKKSALKKELFDTLVTQDRAIFAFTRTAALRTLAGRQAPALAEIERLADEIRDGLVGLPGPGPRDEASPLPPGLTQRIRETLEARTALHQGSRAKIDAILAELPESYPVSFVTALDSTGLKIRLVPRRGTRISRNGPRLAAIMARLNEIGEDHRQRNESLNREIEGLKDDIGRALGPGATPQAVNQAIDAVIRHQVRRENEAAYHDYRTAVFEPGLSPEQRRLLLGAAVRQLDLPLPGGELQPTERRPSW